SDGGAAEVERPRAKAECAAVFRQGFAFEAERTAPQPASVVGVTDRDARLGIGDVVHAKRNAVDRQRQVVEAERVAQIARRLVDDAERGGGVAAGKIAAAK